MEYRPTIGLEIHAELKTRTKMFCDSKNDPDETRPNVNVCPVCMGHPGTLPVINKEAVRHVVRVGVAVDGKIADFTEFDRKNYFYPDIPKGYQISQYKYPLVKGGKLAGIPLTRVHLEEDTAKSFHKDTYSLIDFNRAGVPLMELVTEPAIKSAEEASRFAKELQLLLQYLGASDANMEKGEMRVEANVSIVPQAKNFREFLRAFIFRDPSRAGTKYGGRLGVKVEVKNLNSFRAVERAIAYEIGRQKKLLEKGEPVAQETRGWDENKQETFSQRTKEESHDYRYFPDPDLPKLRLSELPEFSHEALRQDLPELPRERRARYRADFGIQDKDAEILVTNRTLGEYFENTAQELGRDQRKIKLAFNYLVSDVIGLMRWDDDHPITDIGKIRMSTHHFAELIKMTAANEITSRTAKDLLVLMVSDGGDPREIARERGLFQKSDEAELEGTVKKIIAENAAVADDYKKGNEKVLQFFVGQGMRATKGAANPAVLAKLFKRFLS
ncbi:MAG: Asp-tRNA(Asn)/Glu-tRNA(Gln) amidotransferase subunit GatB [Parcubacteria group bacterium]|nr:Asp-tRNA(Asn)/Glu-tRNA(Gln) amidotransferase subunit GatB [Parcubacteria group bacterium]